MVSADDELTQGSRRGQTFLPLRRRRRTLGGVLGGAVLVAAGGLLSPLVIKSPQQMAADARPPSKTVLTAAVEKRVLKDVVILRGELTPKRSIEVTPSGGADGGALVTSVKIKRASRVSAGTAILEISGRPLFVLQGAVPAYRDLKPGASGKDVAQLQAAINRLGFASGDRSGVFGAGTKRALTAFYRSRGYEPLPAGADDAQQLRTLERQVTAAQRQLTDARDLVNSLAADPASTSQQKRDAAKAVTRAQQDLADAQEDLADAQRVAGAMLPQGEVAFLPSFPARVDGLKATLGAKVVSPLVTFSVGELVATAKLTAAQKALCRIGATVEVTGDAGLSATGQLASIGELEDSEQGSDESSGADSPSGYPVRITLTPNVDPKASGLSVRLSIEVKVSDSAELSVPISAIYAGSDGQVYVTKRTPDGMEERIIVVPGMSAQGFVAV